MASMAPRFEVKVNHLLIRSKTFCSSDIDFLLHIQTLLEGNNGGLQRQRTTLRSWVLSESQLRSNLFRTLVGSRLLEAGWPNQATLDVELDQVFSCANSILEKEDKKKKNRSNNEFHDRIVIKVHVRKIVRMDDEATVVELSMQETSKFVPATKESIRDLLKVKLEDDGSDCMICLEKLVSSKMEFATQMPCFHQFHENCIETWLSTSHICPLCGFPMPTNIGKL